jgi:uncharacterized protein YndB with AHSA1/START domain
MEVTREVVLPVPREEIWAALTSPERLADWFAPDVELELEPGGEGVFRWPDGETRRAVVEEVDPERRFAFRWSEDGGGEETLVELELDDAPEGTRVTVTESTTGPSACAGEWAVALEWWAQPSLLPVA